MKLRLNTKSKATAPFAATRIRLAVFSAALTVALSLFMWIMLDASKSERSAVLLGSLLLVACVTIAAQVIYAVKGQIFELDGRLAKREILFSIICFQVIMQFSFGFSLYAVNQTELQNKSFDAAYAYFVTLQQSAAENTLSDYQAIDLESSMPECVEAVFLTDSNDTRGADEYFRFPVNDGKLLMQKSRTYFNGQLRDFAISLLMSLVISVLLMAEMVYLAVKRIDGRAGKSRERNGEPAGPAGYLRQIAFLFYFTGYLGSSFIPIMAHNLSADNPHADFIAGLPYSAEALANCFAILLATRFFRKRGWKPPYMMGAGIFIAGLLLSALSPNVYLLIASRVVAGAGYGFCWMTLRNITTLSGDRAENFSSLSSGIYAGIMCGAAFGAVLADAVGYRAVLFISAVMAVAAAFFPMSMHNQTAAATSKGRQFKLSIKGVFVFSAFLALIVIPTCVSEAFCGYVAPLYISKMGLPTAYVGRVSLIYNLCLVYISSTVLLKLVRKAFRNPLYQCAFHMLLISAALIAAAYFGGFQAMVVAGALLGSADGFGFSVQNAYVLDTQVSERLGHARMLTWFSLLKKFGAMLGPAVFGLFIANGFKGLGIMGILFVVCLISGIVIIPLLQRRNGAKSI